MNNFRKWLCREYSDDLPSEIVKVFENENIPERWLISAARIVHRLSEMPWYTQEEISNEISLTKAELMTLNSFIRESEFLQNMIVYHGLGRKYWNTIIPYVKRGRIQKVINY